jgi:hypothetical protein
MKKTPNLSKDMPRREALSLGSRLTLVAAAFLSPLLAKSVFAKKRMTVQPHPAAVKRSNGKAGRR